MNIQGTRRKCLLQHSLLHQLEVSIIVLSVSPIVNNAVVVVSIDVDHLLAKLDYFKRPTPASYSIPATTAITTHICFLS